MLRTSRFHYVFSCDVHCLGRWVDFEYAECDVVDVNGGDIVAPAGESETRITAEIGLLVSPERIAHSSH